MSSEKKIKLSFNSPVVLWFSIICLLSGGQIYDGVFVQDNISNLTHILGGGVGSELGYVMARNKMGRY